MLAAAVIALRTSNTRATAPLVAAPAQAPPRGEAFVTAEGEPTGRSG
jgi:hypothetical protein